MNEATYAHRVGALFDLGCISQMRFITQSHWSVKAVLVFVAIIALLCAFDLLFDYYFDRKF